MMDRWKEGKIMFQNIYQMNAFLTSKSTDILLLHNNSSVLMRIMSLRQL